MGWRKIRKEDVKRGVCIRFTGLRDSVFQGATITGVEQQDSSNLYPAVYISRPYVYAREHFDSYNGGLLGAENFAISLDSMCREDTDIEVYENEKGEIRSMLT